ncbi:RNA polymerase III transcription factor [Suhomyces tanzawaensis NRRL Y-17324]|uniref:RNA polymerase III transcription factor n=1 Tax=Suhomyces tanzawaensis NRRL Y-17324 TaxID=984487 RepID=A0A1E4SAZ8_9ASCO|nr:RNA polymerase III transcription factor [Suhomyces tanzawaensis NRRL Y-17324]ODV76671.1 RNA polymerase III transcription factor [Suhomyces tanzawaensis NRRL Y-17324]
MLFSCAPSELVAYTLETLSLSGQFGLTLAELWQKIASKLGLSELDLFQQQVIWQWLFFSKSQDQIDLYVTKDKQILPILPNYADFISSHGPEGDVSILPTADTQWKYLTGLEASKKLKAQLGEKPFQLLCEIARHGAEGIISPDLCKATGQDPRSLPSRFKRLSEMGFIIRKSIYHEKTRQHTSLLVHTKFSDEKTPLQSEEFQSSRSTNMLRQLIVQSVRDAPNNLRGFNDLKKELNLNSNKSNSKFFGAIVEALHKSGYVEKLMVRSAEDERLVYSIKFLKDLPKDMINSSDYVDMLNSFDNVEDDFFEEKDEGKEKYPLVNSIYPISSQIHQQISSTRDVGITSKNIVTNLSGTAGYRPWTRILDSMSSYVVDGESLAPLKTSEDKYNDICIIRAYDVEGKYKFYRYYTRDQYPAFPAKSCRNKRSNLSKVQNKPIAKLNTLYFKTLGKAPPGDLLKKKKRQNLGQLASENSKKSKHVDELQRSLRRRESPIQQATSLKNEPALDISLEYDRDSSIDISTPVSFHEVKAIIPDIGTQVKRVRKLMAKPVLATSLKGQKRRTSLLDIVKDLGGVTYTTAKLRRMLDERLGSSTFTDNKTLARDISILISSKDLEVQNISYERAGKMVNRKLLILTDPKLRPSAELIEESRERCLQDHGNKVSQPLAKRRIIESEVTLYQGTPSRSRKPRGKGRLDSLGDESTMASIPARRKRKTQNVEIPLSTLEENSVKTEADDSTMPSLVSKKHRRKSKPIRRSGEKRAQHPPRRFRTSQKFDKTDATTLFRAVVISKTFTRSSIDFAQIALLFDGMDSKTIKQKWTVVRKLVGGLQAVLKGVESFEHIVMKGIEDELVSTDDLENVKFTFFLDLWKDMDSSVLEISDKMPLFNHSQDNQDEYSIVDAHDVQLDLFEQLEDNSMRQKDSILSGITFFVSDSTEIIPPENDDLRTVLKAIFTTPEESFSASRVKQILDQFGDEATHSASSALIKDKEMIYYGSDDSNSRFVLTDKVHNALNLKLPSKFLNQAAQFADNIGAIAEANKGLIISENVLNGHMAPLLTFLASDEATILHIDKTYQFDGYESRLIDKDKLACDVVLLTKNRTASTKIQKIPVPTGKACSHIWLDMNGCINEQMWTKLINAVLVYVHFRPGIPQKAIFSKMQTILGLNDFKSVIQWLVDSQSLRRGSFDGCWTNQNWYSTIGF